MIFLRSQIVLVSSIIKSQQAAQTGFPLLRFGLGLDANGILRRTVAQTHGPNDILCISDLGVSAPVSEETIRLLMEEARSYGGILADIERKNQHLDPLIQSIDQKCREHKIPLFIPYTHCSNAPSAWPLVPGAASGGSLQDELEHGMRLQKGRMAAGLQFVRRRFHLPASDPNGEELTADELLAAQQQTGAHVFFSRELCLNYFTYMEGNTGVFILFDTPETLQMRLELIQKIGVPYIFIEWDGCESLFNRS